MSSTQSEPSGTRPSRPWPADQPERWPIERLIPYATNPRLHTEADIDKIAASIVEFGWTMPPLVDEKGMLIAGAARVAAAAKLKLASIPVIVASGWSKEQKRAYRLVDNQLAARASWDFERLCNELRDLDFAGFDLDLIGFEPDQLETILAGLGSSGLTDPDSVPEVGDQPVTRRGDIWLLGDHGIGCGDSTSAADVAPVLARSEPHLMITDPPYGVGYDPSWRARRGLGAGNLARGKVLNDDRADWREAYALFPGDVAYVWHGALHGDIVAAGLAACGALRSSGPSSTSPWAAAIIIGGTRPAGTPCAKARPATGRATAPRRRSGRFPTTTRSATRSTSRVGGTAPRSRSNACAARSPTTAGPARQSMTRFSARGQA
jgi:hypothetical protein